MRKALLSQLAVPGLVFLATPGAHASLAELTGDWHNTDHSTRGITRLIIRANTMEAWGACHPTACAWGSVPAYAYASNVSEALEPNAKFMKATFVTGFSESVVITYHAHNTLHAEVFTRFTDGSGRTAYHQTYSFVK